MQTKQNTSAGAHQEPPKFVTKPMLAKRYAVCVRTVEHWINERRIPVIRLGRRAVRFDPLKCDQALRKFEVHEAGYRKGRFE
jgi:hypothetical protein